MTQRAREPPRQAGNALDAQGQRNVVGNWALGVAIGAIVLPVVLVFAGLPDVRSGLGALELILQGLGLAILLALVATLLGAYGLARVEGGRRSAITAAWGLGLGLLILIAIVGMVLSEVT